MPDYTISEIIYSICFSVILWGNINAYLDLRDEYIKEKNHTTIISLCILSFAVELVVFNTVFYFTSLLLIE